MAGGMFRRRDRLSVAGQSGRAPWRGGDMRGASEPHTWDGDVAAGSWPSALAPAAAGAPREQFSPWGPFLSFWSCRSRSCRLGGSLHLMHCHMACLSPSLRRQPESIKPECAVASFFTRHHPGKVAVAPAGGHERIAPEDDGPNAILWIRFRPFTNGRVWAPFQIGASKAVGGLTKSRSHSASVSDHSMSRFRPFKWLEWSPSVGTLPDGACTAADRLTIFWFFGGGCPHSVLFTPIASRARHFDHSVGTLPDWRIHGRRPA